MFASVVFCDNSTLEPSRLLGPFSSILQLPGELFDETEASLIGLEPQLPKTTISSRAPALSSTATLDPSLSAVVTKCRDIFCKCVCGVKCQAHHGLFPQFALIVSSRVYFFELQTQDWEIPHLIDLVMSVPHHHWCGVQTKNK